ncbi:MAG: RecQ family ATP-dependent DNA helicase [Bacteroidales bacterium]|nr:RecQ family ATP-dependent DNA helicase [Bacteroidales bacterium]
MKKELLNTLKQYWGYDFLRQGQQEVITSVLNNQDTLALMATGSGKSLCFQLPAMMKNGICIIISPLISLMKDQVSDLEKRNIKAKMLSSEMFSREIEAVLNVAVNNRLKFLFIAPERLLSNQFIEHFKQMNVCLIVVDEAHCISLWGHDFRPSYLKIPKLRQYKPDIPILALTATATKEVTDEIQSLLLFKKNNVLRTSFLRKNLNYLIFKEKNKAEKIANLYNELQGCGLVYARSREKTEKLAKELQNLGINAMSYHAGLNLKERNLRQNLWQNDKIPLIVATTAFGMGINKPDVKYVIHVDLPENMEAFFQETGRAGRNGEEAYVITLYTDKDIYALRYRIKGSFPNENEIKAVYNALFNYYSIPIGAGKNTSFGFDFVNFIEKYHLNPLTTFHILHYLERQDLIRCPEENDTKSRIRLIVSMEYLRNFIQQYSQYYGIIEWIMRQPVDKKEFFDIEEKELAIFIHTTKQQLIKDLHYLSKYKIIDYEPKIEGKKIIFIEERLPDSNIKTGETYHKLKDSAIHKAEKMIKFIEGSVCRQKQLLAYFGEKTENCGKCDVCISQKNKHNKDLEAQIISLLNDNEPQSLSYFTEKIVIESSEKITETVRSMIDRGILELKNYLIYIKKS